MRILVVHGPNAGKVLDYSTRQAESALLSGWAVRPPAVDGTPTAPPAVVDVLSGDSHTYVGEDSSLTAPIEPMDVGSITEGEAGGAKPARKRKGRA